LLREIAAVGEVAHPTLARLLDWGIAGETPFLAYEYLGGGSLADRLRDATLSITALVRTLALVAMGLSVLHRRSWVHGDVKPSNVLFDLTGRPRLADFGLARPVGEPTRDEGVILASSRFAPREQSEGEPLTPAADTYSLCAVLYTGLTGRAVPEPSARFWPVAASVLRGLREEHPELEARFGPLLLRGLSRRPANRFPGGAVLARRLHQCLVQPLPDIPAGGRRRGGWIGAATMAQVVR
jgi:serine/threonine-protein kinase